MSGKMLSSSFVLMLAMTLICQEAQISLASASSPITKPPTEKTEPICVDAEEVVTSLYWLILERDPDPDGLDWYVSKLSSKEYSVKHMVLDMVSSTEHIQRFMSSDREEAIRNLYKHILGREPAEKDRKAKNYPILALPVKMIKSSEYKQNFGKWTVPGSRTTYCIDR